MSSASETGQESRCPTCHHPIRPGTAFCANCGTSVSAITNVPPITPGNDAGATVTYVPLGGTPPGTTRDTLVDRSPWAPPDSQRYVEPIAVAVSNSPVRDDWVTEDGHPSTPQTAGGIRGLVLGTVAVVLIAAVIALYVYDAWLSESTRATVEGWIPW